MNKKHNIFYGQLVKKEDGTIVTTNSSSIKYQDFLKNILPGQTIDVFMEANDDDGTLAQLAKIHACIRQLAKDTGHLPEELKVFIKKKCSLYFTKTYNGNIEVYYKSFSDCSKEELGLVLTVIIELGDFVGINFR